MALLTIYKGDSDTLTETICGLTSLAGYTAKMYIYLNSALKLTLTGTINSLTVSYDIFNEQTKILAVGQYYFESKIFDASDHVYTTSSGVLRITEAKNTDPS